MQRVTKRSQLQLRVTEAEKAAIRRAARRARMDMSAYVLSRVLAEPERTFQTLAAALNGSAEPAYALAEVNTFLCALAGPDLRQAVAAAPEVGLSPYLANYLAAMVEAACNARAVPVPAWTRSIAALTEPVFGSALPSLRLYLLTHASAPFRRRNIFIDASIGAQV